MRYRKLRIACSVVCGIPCLLLMVLWIWSYFSFVTVSHAFEITVRLREGKVVSYSKWPVKLTGGQWSMGTWPRDRPVDSYATVYGFALVPLTKHVHDYVLIVPFWFLVILGGSLAGIPWLPYSRRFSLRTLLIATTLVAVILGAVIYVSR